MIHVFLTHTEPTYKMSFTQVVLGGWGITRAKTFEARTSDYRGSVPGEKASFEIVVAAAQAKKVSGFW